jgi:hypothetical protein
MAARGLAIPAAYFSATAALTDSAVAATQSPAAQTPALKPGTGQLIRDFADPYLELIRLLQHASEIEHGLMAQYLYAAFSVKPAYQKIAGFGNPNANDLLGVALQEMQHLAAVNRLLVELGSAPHLARQDFPHEPEIYPFAFELQPLSRGSLAKYVYCEAPVDATDPRLVRTEADRKFHAVLMQELGPAARINHVGSLYKAILSTLDEVNTAKLTDVPELSGWRKRLQVIMDEGEVDHYAFFRSLLMGTHEGFNGHPDIWSLNPSHPDYPAMALGMTPTAYVGQERQIQDPTALALAWLSDLQYWAVLSQLDMGFRIQSEPLVTLAKRHMLGPVWALARQLPKYGVGLPFDPLVMGYATGTTPVAGLRMVRRLLTEVVTVERKLAAVLPADYPFEMTADSIQVVDAEIAAARGNAIRQAGTR